MNSELRKWIDALKSDEYIQTWHAYHLVSMNNGEVFEELFCALGVACKVFGFERTPQKAPERMVCGSITTQQFTYADADMKIQQLTGLSGTQLSCIVVMNDEQGLSLKEIGEYMESW